MPYQAGQRVELVHTNDPYTRLRPGARGTVTDYHPDLHTVDIAWDDGSTLSMLLDAGDRIRVLREQPAPALAEPASHGDGWAVTLTRLRAAGRQAGRDVAEWWAQDIIGGRATGDVRPAARRILAGIDDGDPAVLDTLPTFTPPPGWGDRDTAEVRYIEAAPPGLPDWARLTDAQRADTIEASRDGFDTAVVERVTQLCHLAASPTGRDLSHLHPDRVHPGGVGVFGGDWAWTAAADGARRIPVGFVGILASYWNGWAVFTCTRAVAEAIAADHHQHRERYRHDLQDAGVTGEQLDRQVDQALGVLRFDGDTIVADQRAVQGDPDAVARMEPDDHGAYTVMGRCWTWQAVDPYDCDRIVGDLPAAD